MKTLFQSALVDVCFEITWKKDGIHHSDRYFADHLNGWRDIFSGSPLEILSGQDLSTDLRKYVLGFRLILSVIS